MIPCELDISSTTFEDVKIITYEIKLPSIGNQIGFNLMDDDDFKTPYIIDTIPNFPVSHKLPTQDKKNAWIISINVEDIITTKGELEKLQHYHKNMVDPT